MSVILSLLGSGAGGGIIGGLFGIWKQRQERLERIEMANIELKRDELEYANDREERDHALAMLERSGELELEKVATEAEAEVEITNQQILGEAQLAEFKNLNTSPFMDNFRSSVRPVLAYVFTALFITMLIWAFKEYNSTITQEQGKEILLGLFITLEFTVTSIIAFYYVSRRNAAPKV